jgi:hypothetical protein
MNKTVSVWIGARQMNNEWNWSHNENKVLFSYLNFNRKLIKAFLS